MNIALTPDLQEFVDTKIASGLYRSPIEVIGDALRLLQERDHLEKRRWQELRHEIARGLEQLDKGQKAPLNMAEIKHKARELHARRQPLSPAD
jgi:antitoxin ParD1/3/4